MDTKQTGYRIIHQTHVIDAALDAETLAGQHHEFGLARSSRYYHHRVLARLDVSDKHVLVPVIDMESALFDCWCVQACVSLHHFKQRCLSWLLRLVFSDVIFSKERLL